MTSTCTNTTIRPTARRLPLLSWVKLAWRARSTRNDLKTLDPALLKDIGVSESRARQEAGRPFWDVPDYWLR